MQSESDKLNDENDAKDLAEKEEDKFTQIVGSLITLAIAIENCDSMLY